MGLFDRFKPDSPTMRVCMMGPKAVGKTTVMTSVFNETQQSIAGTSLNLTARGETNAALTEKYHELSSVFADRSTITDNNGKSSSQNVTNMGMYASAVQTGLFFGFGHLGKEPVIQLQIKDFPGEMVVKEPESVMKFINESQSIFIAIDTPHLMERNGEFNAVKNKPKQITDLFRKAISDIKSEKLVIFIPLKCEKYFHEGRMGEVLNKIQSTYAELIKLLDSTKKVCSCIEPILTLGDVEFDDFSYDASGNVLLAPDGCPANVKYKYVGEGKYSPLFCSQPLYSLLLFVAAQYKREKARTGIFARIKNMIWDAFKKDESLLDDILKMNTNRITNNEKLGYKVLCGAYLFNVKDN